MLQQIFQLFVVLRQFLELLAELLHFHLERGRRGRDGVGQSRGVSPGNEFVQRVEGARTFVVVHLSIGKVFEGGVGLDLEAVGELRFFGGVDLGDEDTVLRIFLLEAFIEVLPSDFCIIVLLQ